MSACTARLGGENPSEKNGLAAMCCEDASFASCLPFLFLGCAGLAPLGGSCLSLSPLLSSVLTTCQMRTGRNKAWNPKVCA